MPSPQAKHSEPYSLKHTSRRLLTGAAAGAALFAAGALLGQHIGWSRLYAALGGQPDTPATSPDAQNRAVRAALLAARQQFAAGQATTLPVPLNQDGYFVPPSDDELPKGPMGESIRHGRDIFVNTGQYAAQYVGNSMACAQCHLDAGRRPNAAPMWAAYVQYPKYREKNHKINTLEERIAGCFNFSMNAQASAAGKAPAPGDPIYKDLMTYMYWLADGAPTGAKLRGAGYRTLKKPAQGYDFQRGAKVYQQNCALCHGAEGQGGKDRNGKLRFPPLWGPESYNWGAGMHSIKTAAGFIKANMPLGAPDTLSDQDAWDVAAFINGHERPKDPRQTGTIEQARAEHHKGDNYYGQVIDGKLLGQGVSRDTTGN